MNILGLDTSASACSIGILTDQTYLSQHHIAPMQQSKLILPMIKGLLEKANLTLQDFDAIAFGCGPGSFTGMRIAASITQGLAYAANLPVIPISSLAVLAQTAYQEKNCQHALVALDARMEEIYWAEYQIQANGLMSLVGDEKIYALAHLDQLSVKEKDGMGIGDAWDKYSEKLIQSLHFHPQAIHSTLIPHVDSLLALAKQDWLQGKYITADKALPNYLR